MPGWLFVHNCQYFLFVCLFVFFVLFCFPVFILCSDVYSSLFQCEGRAVWWWQVFIFHDPANNNINNISSSQNRSLVFFSCPFVFLILNFYFIFHVFEVKNDSVTLQIKEHS